MLNYNAKEIASYINVFINQYDSENTKKNYQKILCDLFKNLNKPLQEITKLDLKIYVQDFKNLSTNSQALKISAIKSFFKFLYENDVLDKDLGVALKRPRISQNPKSALSKEDALKMLAATDNARNKAIIGIYLSTGMRVQELIDLQLQDYLDNPEVLTILTKGNKYRTIVLNPQVRELIDNYLKVRKEGVSNLFVSNYGNKMTAQQISNMLKRLAQKIGFEGNISNHTLRSTFITDIALEHGILIAQQVVGHNSVETTKRYVRGIQDTVNDVMRNITL